MKRILADNLPSREKLWELFSYDPDTGQLTNLDTGNIYGSRKNKVKDPTSKYIHWYVNAYIDGVRYAAHRIIWKMVYGYIPEGMTIDHIDLDKQNNKLSNLRLATLTQQMTNRRAWSGTGYKGVYPITWAKCGGFVSRIKVDDKLKYIGTFATAEEAAFAYDEASRKFHGQYGRTTFSSSSS
jgi:hypothetical protein